MSYNKLCPSDKQYYPVDSMWLNGTSALHYGRVWQMGTGGPFESVTF